MELHLDKDTTCTEIKKEATKKDQDVTEKIEDLQQIKEILLELSDSFAVEDPKKGVVRY